VKRLGWATAVLLTLVTPLVSACVRTDEGVAVRSSSAATTTTERPQTPTKSTEDAGPAAPGIVSTTRGPVPAATVGCPLPVEPAVSAAAQVSDPAAPKVTVAVPDGWSQLPGSGDVGLRLQGPDGMFATVTIAPTTLDPAAAFTEYADEVMEVSAVTRKQTAGGPMSVNMTTSQVRCGTLKLTAKTVASAPRLAAMVARSETRSATSRHTGPPTA